MTLKLSVMRANVRKATGLLDEADLPTTDIDLALNKAYWFLQDKFHYREEEASSTFVTAAGVGSYTPPVDTDAIKSLAVEDLVNDEHRPLDPITADVYETYFVNNSDNEGAPVAYLLEEKTIKLLPVPDDIYTITLRRHKLLAELVGVDDVPVIPRAWHEIIEIGGKWRILADQGDLTRSTFWATKEAELINSLSETDIKEKSDRHRSGLNYIGRVPFGQRL